MHETLPYLTQTRFPMFHAAKVTDKSIVMLTSKILPETLAKYLFLCKIEVITQKQSNCSGQPQTLAV